MQRATVAAIKFVIGMFRDETKGYYKHRNIVG
jgi:hypothetical protein